MKDLTKFKPGSSRQFQKGEIILKEKPFVYVLKSKYRTERCDYCLSATDVLKCLSCKYVFYCNRECQKSAWPFHKFECGFLKRIYPRTIPDAVRMISRIILRLKNNGDLDKGYYTDTQYRKFNDLMSHYSEIKNDANRREHFESIEYVLRDIFDDVVIPNSVELLGIYGRLVVNGFNILDAEMNPLATGLYLGVSVTDHDCQPNAVATFEGTTLYVRALEDIEDMNWSKIFISYIDVMNTPQDRRAELQANYYFMCECKKCVNPIESIEMQYAACPNKNCDAGLNLLGKTVDQCEKCGEEVTDKFREEFDVVMEMTKNHLINMKDTNVAYLDVCKICLQKQENVLHKVNIWRTKTLDMAFESAIDINKWDDALDFGRKLIPGFRKYNGNLNPLVGLLYMKMGKILLFKEQLEEAMLYLKGAAKIIKITHGKEHSLYRQQLIPLLLQASSSSI